MPPLAGGKWVLSSVASGNRNWHSLCGKKSVTSIKPKVCVSFHLTTSPLGLEPPETKALICEDAGKGMFTRASFAPEKN